ncbi:MAG: DUF1007 family protein [Pseudomonadota bacterium]
MTRHCWILMLALGAAPSASAHPHVFVDGGVDFILGEDRVLEALAVTWRFDAFETLYTINSNGLSLDAEGQLSAMDLAQLTRVLAAWPKDFEGSAHLSLDGAPVALAPPKDLTADLVDGRLEVTFTRDLTEPLATAGQMFEVSFHEATYFYAFSLTDPPVLDGDSSGCSHEIVPFEPSEDDSALQTLLGALDREETPEIANVGALFADWVYLICD